MDCRSASAADCVSDCGEGVQWPNERKPIFFTRFVLSSVLDLGSMLGKSANGLFGLTLHFRFPRRSQWVNETPARPVSLQASSRLQSLTSIDSKEHYPFEA